MISTTTINNVNYDNMCTINELGSEVTILSSKNLNTIEMKGMK